MTGNQDRTARASKRAGVMKAVDMMIEHALTVLAETPLKPGDALGIQRYMRAAEQIAKTQRANDALADPDETPAVEKHAAEDDMADDEDDSPDAMDRIYRELKSRIDHSRTSLERKRVDGWTVVRTEPGGGEGDAQAA